MKANSPDSFPPLGLVQPRHSLSRTLFTALVSLVVVLIGTRIATAANSPATAITVNFGALSIGVPGITVGTLVATDPDAGQTHTFTLVPGEGDTNNGLFVITAPNTLKFAPAVALALQNYHLRVRATDNGSPPASGEFTLTLLFAPVVNTAPSFTLTSGETWTPRTSAGARIWSTLASSADGRKLVAAEAAGKIFTSTDAGQTWTQRAAGGAADRSWRSLASSADGQKLVAGEQPGALYTSADGGATWAARSNGLPAAASSVWLGLASSADGLKLVAANQGGALYTSIDGGGNWAARSNGLPVGTPAWKSVASSTNGQWLAAVAAGGRIYTSTDAGTNWVARDSVRPWQSIASSADGMRLVAVENDLNGRIHTSTDAGTNWTEQANSPFDQWVAIASSADGRMLAAVPEAGLPCISWDTGLNWTYVNDGIPGGLAFWAAIALSADGRRVVAADQGVGGGGLLFTSEPGARLLTSSAAQPRTFAFFAFDLAPGTPGEGGQVLDFNLLTTDNAALFDVPPAINPTNGTLTFTIKAGAIGNATATVRLHDDGGTADGGTNTSAPQTFLITVLPGITGVAAPPAGDYQTGATLTFAVTNSSAVTVSGTPQLRLLFDSTVGLAAYDPATSTATVLKFKYVLLAGDLAPTGVFAASPLVLNGGTIRSGAFDAGLTFGPPDTSGVLVRHPTTTVAAPATVNASVAAQNVTLTAAVTAVPGTAGPVNAGAVTFQLQNGAANVGTAVTSATVAGGAASVTYSLPANTAAGTYTIVAIYSGGGSFNGSSGNGTLTVVSATPNVAPSFMLDGSEWTVSTLAGAAGQKGSTDGTGAAAQFSLPVGVAVDSTGNVHVGDSDNSTIRKITPAGEVSTLAGAARQVGTTDGAGAAAKFNRPQGVAMDSAGNVYAADTGSHTIRKITPGGVVSTLAGFAKRAGTTDGAGAAARFSNPQGVAVDSAGNVYVADGVNHTIRKITPAGVVSTLAGTAGQPGSTDGMGAAAKFRLPQGVAVDSAGNVYVAERDNHTIRKITPAGLVSTLAGAAGLANNTDGAGADARFSSPTGVAVDSAGNVYVADAGNNTIRKINSGGRGEHAGGRREAGGHNGRPRHGGTVQWSFRRGGGQRGQRVCRGFQQPHAAEGHAGGRAGGGRQRRVHAGEFRDRHLARPGQ